MSFVKSLLEARDTLLEEMRRLSKAVGQTIDFSEFVSTMDNNTLLPESVEDEDSGGQGKQQNNLEVLALFCNRLPFIYCFSVLFTIFWNMNMFLPFLAQQLNASLDLESDDWLHNFSKDHLSRTFHLLGTQLHYLWNTFLTFHR